MSVLVGRQAPDFIAPAVLGNGEIVEEFHLSKVTKGKYAVIVFYPLDFTFVCPSELIALDHRVKALQEKGVEVISVSVDSHFTHNAWRNTAINNGGIGPVKYTMVADISHKIMQSYGVEHPQAGVAFRATFLIDRNGLVRHQVVNDLPLGRNMDEIGRMVDALHFFDEHGEVCPAGWKQGDPGMKADPAGVANYLASHATKL
ncbi:MAG: tsaA [Gammaproteobacteria bacterium]|jgi:peroxiredoxin (alkyl hydroperoxide reductase subunit C)|nr:tsaA [Gammaproteobacteria bacterium]